MINYPRFFHLIIFSSVQYFILTDVYSMIIYIILIWLMIAHSEDSFQIIFLVIVPLCTLMNLLPMFRMESIV